jgi:hypothetical protein
MTALTQGRSREGVAMNDVSVAKSAVLNVVEGLTLIAICQAFPTFASTVMMLKLAHDHQIVDDPARAAIFVPLASLLFALLTGYLGPKFPRFFKTYEPAFFDPTLSFTDKIVTWRERPSTSVQLVTVMILLSLLAVAVVSMG